MSTKASTSGSGRAPSKRRRKDELADEGGREDFGLSTDEKGEVEDKRPPRAVVLHEIIRREGEVELERNLSALLLSSFAAGLSMGFSMLARGLLHSHLAPGPSVILLESWGYTIGFVIVILSRQQLFTENTITAVLPLVSKPSFKKFGQLLRLWSSVLAGNLVGVAVFAFGILHLAQFDESAQHAFVEMGTELMQNSPWQMFTKGILSGWIIAIMVWMLASADHAKILIILLMTYFIGVAGFTHIVVGSAETLYLVFTGHLSFGSYAVDFALPTLIGNIVGGSLIFALLSHAQVRSDAA